MKQLAETDDSVGGMILRVVDSIVNVGVMAVVAGIVERRPPSRRLPNRYKGLSGRLLRPWAKSLSI